MNSRISLLTAVLSVLIVSSAQAAPIVVPPSLNLGDQYRLAFVTSEPITAESPDIVEYNDFVQEAADAVPELAALGTTWNAIGSTEDVAARDNTSTNPSTDAGVPIYLLDGNLLASGNSDLWDGSIATALNVTQEGETLPEDGMVWTGTLPDGTSAARPLGDETATVLGLTDSTTADWIAAGATRSFLELSIYAVSNVLVVPEPSSVFLLGLGFVVLAKARIRTSPSK